MRLGVFAKLSGSAGGVYQYTLAVLNALNDWPTLGQNQEAVLITSDDGNAITQSLREKGWTIAPMPPWAERIAGLGRLGSVARNIVGDEIAWQIVSRVRPVNLDDGSIRRPAQEFLKSVGVDLMLYPLPTPMSYWSGVPYVMAVHDLQHRLNPQFPEVGANGQWEGRERLYRNATRHATLLIAESQVGRDDLLTYYGRYGLSPEMVDVLPYVCPPYVRRAQADELEQIRGKYGLIGDFLFYPAQFWPHKNHLRVVEAIAANQRSGLRMQIVFSGSHPGRLRNKVFRNVWARARQLGIEDQIRYIGYIPDEDMPAMYTAAKALVMPTFFGPTNIPFLEAWKCGCPVVTSRLRGIREQVGDAALLVDPDSVDEIASGLNRIWTDGALRAELVANGSRRVNEFTEADFKAKLVGILARARSMTGDSVDVEGVVN